MTALRRAYSHDSAGTYSMVAMWAKGSRRYFGFNALNRRARTVAAHYPDRYGMHCELDLVNSAPGMRGGTVYVVGRKNSSNNPMTTTRPCFYCQELLEPFTSIVFFEAGEARKVRAGELGQP